MKKKVVYKDGRKKAFIGAIVGTVAGIAGNMISAKKKRKAEEAAFNKAQQEQYRLDGNNAAAAMTDQFANQDYVDDYRNKITLKAGGSVKYKKGKDKDRLAHTKKYALGGRSKALLGTEEASKFNLGSEAMSASGGLAGLATSLFSKPKVAPTIKKADPMSFGAPKTSLTPNSYETDELGNPVVGINNPNGVVAPNLGNNLVNPRMSGIAKMGTKRKNKSI